MDRFLFTNCDYVAVDMLTFVQVWKYTRISDLENNFKLECLAWLNWVQ